MSAQMPPVVPRLRSDQLFNRIQRIVDEVSCVDRALLPFGESLCVEEALEQISTLIRANTLEPLIDLSQDKDRNGDQCTKTPFRII